MLLHDINYNILIYHPYITWFYTKINLKMRALPIDIYLWGVGTKPQKTDETLVHDTHAIMNI